MFNNKDHKDNDGDTRLEEGDLISPNPLDYNFTPEEWDEMHEACDGTINVFDAVCVEAKRQNCREEGAIYLAWAHAEARDLAKRKPISEKAISIVAELVEPSTAGQYRRTAVTFASGGSAVAAELVPTAMARWIEGLHDAVSEHHMSCNPAAQLDVKIIDEFIREFLVIHPFKDGNGRTAWILRTWLRNNWFNPEPLPDYDFFPSTRTSAEPNSSNSKD